MLSSDILMGPRLKVERAYRHIDELRWITEPLSADFYFIVLNNNTLATDGYATLTYQPTKPIPEMLALIIGDAAHNLRSALDHLCTGIIRTVDAGAKQHFPIHPTRKNFETAPVLAMIEQALPGSKNLLIDKIRPENGANEALWRFNDLDNDDKHNLLIPTVTVAKVTGLQIKSGPVTSFGQFSGNAAEPIKIMKSGQPITIEGNVNTFVDVKFGKGTPFQDDPVIPTLTQIAGVVTDTLQQFETLINA